MRNHPVHQLLDAAASGGLPSERELDALKLPPAVRRDVSDVAQVAAATRLAGQNAEARRYARAGAERIVGALAPELREPDYLKAPDTEPHDPAGLASGVARW